MSSVGRSLGRAAFVVVVAAWLAACTPLRAAAGADSTWQPQPALSRLFDAAGVEGTLLVHDLERDVTWVHNPLRARRGFGPASTFKIVNALVAIDTEVVKDADKDVFAYAGTPFLVRGQPFLPRECNADITLATAFRYSCVPVFQTLARRVGMPRYERLLRDIGYGSGRLDGERVDSFWLDGRYTVSAEQQIAFLRRLHERDLPFSRPTIETVKEMMVVDQGPNHVLRAKSGHLFSTQPEIGWLVGWLERGSRTYFFALNLDLVKPEDAKARRSIVDAALAEIERP